MAEETARHFDEPQLAAIVPWEFGAVPLEWLGRIGRSVDELWVLTAHIVRPAAKTPAYY